MSFPNFVLGTIHETYSFRKTLDDVLSELAKRQSAPITRAIRGMLSFSGAAKGVLGGFHYDVTQSSYNRLESEVISAEALLIASKSDDFIENSRFNTSCFSLNFQSRKLAYIGEGRNTASL